ncbi:hypothetical protein C1S99_10870 [Vibrio parahaemolyticus]|uniref:hypothetical protein n=1 Tax=Vibrio parahaemolyticus TaxID=670 RepID=UPI000C86A023|nr:hypothetical protein [Vibrio parahaemolyticus]EJB8688777.1 hypothetical protein [Vibrio parahaemolyticus]PMS42211.1 hypothetical protein C1T12_11355 [Vibrio parahaemolyticus]PMS62271.1 hypothetical protein C1S91_15600 [Vibrio parahaemolyticus]PMS68200.1 hypothetical protein C1S96_11785 [Vibrio parahaemolyticus]PMS72972.1 hypothetical protein C1T10_14565 [Vibrio parahaemolyticus]
MNKLLLAANEKGLARIMLKVRDLQGAFAGGERRLILRSTDSRNTLIVSMLTSALDMALSFHERDMHTNDTSTIIPMVLKRLEDYSERLRKAMHECEPDAEFPSPSGNDDAPDNGDLDNALALAMDALSIEIAPEQLSQPYALERDALFNNAKGRSISLQSSDDSVLSIGQKNTLLPQAFGDAKLLIKVAKKGDEPAQDFELAVNIKQKSTDV